MMRHILTLFILVVPSLVLAQTAPASGAPVVFFSIFGPNASDLQRFYDEVFEWKATPSGEVTVPVPSPLVGTIAAGMSETQIYIGVPDVTAILQKVTAHGGTIRFPRTEVPGRVVLGMFKDPAGNSVGLVEMENGRARVP